MTNPEDFTEDRVDAAQLEDARRAVIYLVVHESAQYIAIMDVLEASITDLTPAEVGARLQAAGTPIEQTVVEARLDKLREWAAVSARTDTSRILRHADLLARNWRYTATPGGRQVQRFYRKVLAGAPAAREIPLSSLARVVEAAETLASLGTVNETNAELIGQLFVNHDHLDAALVGAEDSLAGLVDRFDLDDESIAELKTLLVGYATHVAAELEKGSARAYRALSVLRPRFAELAMLAVRASEAHVLIERGALAASHGGRLEDWEALFAWLDPFRGRSTRFALRLVRALPGMHVNLRRLHTSAGSATSRGRALMLAKACLDPTYGAAILMAALGDHPWRKLYGEAEDTDVARTRSWRDGPFVEVPQLLRATGRSGARGSVPPARDDAAAREAVRERREQRVAAHVEAIKEILASPVGACMSERAARVALASLLAAVRADSSEGRRKGVCDGLSCTLLYTPGTAGTVIAPNWRVVTPDRTPAFHLPGSPVSAFHPVVPVEERERPSLLVME